MGFRDTPESYRNQSVRLDFIHFTVVHKYLNNVRHILSVYFIVADVICSLDNQMGR